MTTAAVLRTAQHAEQVPPGFRKVPAVLFRVFNGFANVLVGMFRHDSSISGSGELL
jgi:hypothetical protein